MTTNLKYILLTFAVALVIILFEIASVKNNLFVDAKKSVSSLNKDGVRVWHRVLAFEKGGNYPVVFRAVFKIENPDVLTYLSLKKPLHVKKLTLNGKEILKPMKGMSYKMIPGIRHLY